MAVVDTLKYLPGKTFSLTADVDLSSFQYGIVGFKAGDASRAVKYDGTAAAGKLPPAGLLLNDPKSGEEALVYDLNAGGKLLGLFGGAVAVDTLVIVDANGKLVAYTVPGLANDIVWIVGRTLEASAADGNVKMIWAQLHSALK